MKGSCQGGGRERKVDRGGEGSEKVCGGFKCNPRSPAV